MSLAAAPRARARPALAAVEQAVVIGGGPAGAAAAIALGRAGLAPLLIERDAETRDTLCGGFLSWMTVRRLVALGVDPFALGAHRVTRLAVFAGRRSGEAALPAAAAGLSRRALDTAMLAQAEMAGARIERGVAARAFDAARLRLDDGGMVAARNWLLATGKHELRGCQRPRVDGDPAIGLRWRIAASPALDRMIGGRIELHLFRGGYAGLVRHEDGAANLCLAVRRSRFAELGSRTEVQLAELERACPALGERLDAAAEIDPPQAIANIPYGWRAGAGDGDCFRIGDQAAVIPSLAGEGIALALASGAAAAQALLRGEEPGAWQRRFSRGLGLPFAVAGALWHAGERPWGAAAITGAVRMAPGLATAMARWTRVDTAAA